MQQQVFTVDQVMSKLAELKDRRADVEIELKNSEPQRKLEQIDAAMASLQSWLHKKLLETGVDKFTVDGVGTFNLEEKEYIKCPAADWPEFQEWVREHERDDMYYKKVLVEPVREYLKETGKLPPGLALDTVKEPKFTRARKRSTTKEKS